jgi:CheY-like chemotaxis protein
MLGRTLGEHIEVRLETAANSPWVLVDPARLETAILNLAVNARDAMPRGGHLVIRTRNEHGRGRTAAGEWVTISVIDDGAGMTPEVVARARQPFFTTKADGHGTGLGLSIVQALARESGGRLRIESRPGIRTAVALMLPVAAAPAIAALSDNPRRDTPTGSESILLVEDDRIVRAHVETTLIDLGYRVASVAESAGALEWLAAHKWIDLLFTDMVLPGGISGGELAKRIRDRLPRLKVLYTSGYAAPPEWTSLGPDSAFLPKPFRRAGLGAAVRALLDRAAA